MDRASELRTAVEKEASALLASIEERLSMLRASGISPEELDEIERLVKEIRSQLAMM